uniref:transposase n=1 Tax=Streptomyces ruber TaxID=83378 RepID=UPI003570D26E
MPGCVLAGCCRAGTRRQPRHATPTQTGDAAQPLPRTTEAVSNRLRCGRSRQSVRPSGARWHGRDGGPAAGRRNDQFAPADNTDGAPIVVRRQRFVNQSTWHWQPVRRRIRERMLPLIQPVAVGDRRCVGARGRDHVRRRAPAALRRTGQAGQLPGRGQHPRGQRDGVVSAAVAVVPARGLGGGSRPPDQDRRPARSPTERSGASHWALDTLADWGMTPPVMVAEAACGTTAPLHRRGRPWTSAGSPMCWPSARR